MRAMMIVAMVGVGGYLLLCLCEFVSWIWRGLMIVADALDECQKK